MGDFVRMRCGHLFCTSCYLKSGKQCSQDRDVDIHATIDACVDAQLQDMHRPMLCGESVAGRDAQSHIGACIVCTQVQRDELHTEVHQLTNTLHARNTEVDMLQQENARLRHHLTMLAGLTGCFTSGMLYVGANF